MQHEVQSMLPDVVTCRLELLRKGCIPRFSRSEPQVCKWQRMEVRAATSPIRHKSARATRCKSKSTWRESRVHCSIASICTSKCRQDNTRNSQVKTLESIQKLSANGSLQQEKFRLSVLAGEKESIATPTCNRRISKRFANEIARERSY